MNSKLKLWARISWSFVLALFFIMLQFRAPVKTGAITDLSVTVDDKAKGATTTYTVTFTLSKDLNKYGGKINVYFNGPSSYNSSGTQEYGSNFPNFYSATIESGTTSTIGFSQNNYNGAQFSTSSNIEAGTTVTLKIGNVKNPSVGGYYVPHVWTSSYWSDLDGSGNWGGDYNGSAVEIGTNTNITGKVTDSDGVTPVPFTSISMYTSSGSYGYHSTYADKNGNYGIGDVPAGDYYFSISAPYSYSSTKTYFPPDTKTITIPASGQLTENINFKAVSKKISGKITKTTENGTAVTNANVYASKAGGSGYANADTDSEGNYTLNLTGGTWRIGLSTKTWPSDWIYTVYDETISFTDDNSAETKTKNFVVEAVDSTITGSFKKPDGTTPAEYAVGMSFTSGNKYFYASSDASGNFSVRVTKGTFSVSGWVSDPNFSFPKISNVTIGENETKNLGTITLIEKTDSITGTITDSAGAAVAGAYVSASKNDGTYDWASTTSAADGTYTLKVTPGVWQVSAYPQWNSAHVYNGKPTPITVTSGVVATKNFVFQKVTSVITGSITDSNGNTLTNLSSWVSANDGSSEWGYIGASVEKGVFTLKVPAGTWTLTASLYNSDYSSPDPLTITIGDNETKTVNMKAVQNNSTISGTLYDDSGNKITNKWVSIYATKGKYGSWQSASIDQTNGTYSIKVSEGTWKLGWWIDSALGYSSGMGQDIEVAVGANENKTQDITFKKADSKITGKVTKADGSTMQWAWITADTRDPNEKKAAESYYYSNGASSDSSGNYELKLPAGTYWVGGSMYIGSGYINPKKQKVTISADSPATIDLVFRNADSTITGTVTGGSAVSSYVTAWSEDGGYTETNSANEGSYSLSVSSGTIWHIRAKQQVGNDVYKSIEYIVDMTGTNSATQNIEITKQSFTLPEAKTVTIDPTKQSTVTLDDGTNIIIPANTLGTSGQVSLSVEPDIDLAEEADAKPIDYGYSIEAIDQTGKEITTFSGNVTIEDKYTDEILEESNVLDAEELIPAYYNESTSTWDELNGTVNEAEKTVSYQTNHFTKFALVSASDSTSPSAPTAATVTTGDSKVKISWTNPSASGDFAGIKIYTSQEQGKLGDLAATISSTTTTEQVVENLTNNTVYYFTVRAFDTSGNISTNSDQVTAKPGIMPITGTDFLNWITSAVLLVLLILGAYYLYGQKRRIPVTNR